MQTDMPIRSCICVPALPVAMWIRLKSGKRQVAVTITKPKIALSNNRKSSDPASSLWEPPFASVRLAAGGDHGVDAPQIVHAMAARAGTAAAIPLRRNDEATASKSKAAAKVARRRSST